jgi:oligopeptide/dipeptide ABC transporter ATP-binding protein
MTPVTSEPALEVTDLVKHYKTPGRGVVHALDGVSLTVRRGEVLGLVGESGCGKSTLARIVSRLEKPDSGTVRVAGEDVTQLRGRALRGLRSRVQMVFQDPYGSLNPRMRVGDALEEVLETHRGELGSAARHARVAELLGLVGLPDRTAARLPHQLSGGQRQRVGIARALAVEPEILLLDEPVTALDVSVRAEVMNLLSRLRRELDLTYVFISHDLGMVRHMSDRVAVMYLGQIVEVGPWRQVSDDPGHPYARALQEAVPVADPSRYARTPEEVVRGEVPDAAAPPPACRFHPRCPLVEQVCRTEEPQLLPLGGPDHRVACHVAQRAVGQQRPA